MRLIYKVGPSLKIDLVIWHNFHLFKLVTEEVRRGEMVTRREPQYNQPLPASVPHLATSLAYVDVDDFPHCWSLEPTD